MKKHQKSNFYNFIFFCFLYLYLCLSLKTFVSQFKLNNNYFDFYIVKNTGAAFSIFGDANYGLAVFAFLVSLGLIIFVCMNLEKMKKYEVQAYAFLLAGISSNMLERFVFGGVIDYFRLKFIDFPIFNLADIFINIGVFVLIFAILQRKQVEIE